jgi:UDP-N-acetylmuramate dehydrogenase
VNQTFPATDQTKPGEDRKNSMASKSELMTELQAAVSAETVLRQDEPLARRTTLRVGGSADFYVEPASETELSKLLQVCQRRNVPFFLLGRGSNLLVRDRGIRGLVICLGHPEFSRIETTGYRMHCGAGAKLKLVAAEAKKAQLTGLEFLEGIPGTVGGGLRMNAGAYGREFKDVLQHAVALDAAGNKHVLPLAALGLSYRHSAVAEDWIFVEATFAGEAGDSAVIGRRMGEIQAARESSQPIRARTGGSTFANPLDQKAWELIDRAGCRGLVRGGAMISEKHANFLINTGSATAADIEGLGEEVRRRVRESSGITLDWEIRRIGRPTEGTP